MIELVINMELYFDNKSASLLELSQELARFNYDLQGKFRCPTCLRDLSITNDSFVHEDDIITEEHIIPKSVGGKVTTFLCKKCNSTFGAKQTKWFADWIELNEGKAPFSPNPKKQKASLTSNGITINGSLSLSNDGAIEFISDRKRSNPKHYDKYWSSPKPSEINISHNMPVFKNEGALRAGFLTAAYGLWFKSFGYSWVLQKALDDVRRQILNPEEDIITWNYLIETSVCAIETPSVGLVKIGDQIFPYAHVYDHLVLFPSAQNAHPQATPANEISYKLINMEPKINKRFQHRCVGPSSLVCDGCKIISPDVFSTTTVPTEEIQWSCWM